MEKLIYQGKTKDVYENSDGTYTLKMKDDATGKDGIFDPGENAVGLKIDGFGLASLRLSKFYFEKLTEAGIPHHYLGCDMEAATMNVKAATMFGKGVEFICRKKADGSFLRRYGAYAKFGQELDYFVEATLKDDERLDPTISKEALVLLNIMDEKDYETCEMLTRKITQLISEDLEEKGLELFDIKFEFGKDDNEIMLIDEISEGCMRVYYKGEKLKPKELGGFM